MYFAVSKIKYIWRQIVVVECGAAACFLLFWLLQHWWLIRIVTFISIPQQGSLIMASCSTEIGVGSNIFYWDNTLQRHLPLKLMVQQIILFLNWYNTSSCIIFKWKPSFFANKTGQIKISKWSSHPVRSFTPVVAGGYILMICSADWLVGDALTKYLPCCPFIGPNKVLK